MSLAKKIKLDSTMKKDSENESSSSENFSEILKSKENIKEISVQDDKLKNTENVADLFLKIELELSKNLKKINFPDNVKYVYNPLEYAFKTHSMYVEKYCASKKKVLFLGMNPGPFGMVQTGVPFGEIKHVRDWLKIEGEVGKPANECPNRVVLGFKCPQSEVSGQKLWSLLKKICKTPEVFFQNATVYNYCPIALLNNNGWNVTPEDLGEAIQNEFLSFCDNALMKILKLLEVEVVIAIGRFAQKRAEKAVELSKGTLKCAIKYLLHPSPRVIGNENWVDQTENRFKEHDLNLMQYFVKTS